VNKDWKDPLLVLAILVATIVVAAFLLRNVVRSDFGGCPGGGVGCSVSNAPG